jgi:diaminopimelate epimerase
VKRAPVTAAAIGYSDKMAFEFVKMNGLGNDFVIVSAETAAFDPSCDQVQAIADRKVGIGCDQLIAITRSDRAHAGMRIWNADGGEVEACGNAARCVAWLLMSAVDLDRVRVDTPVGVLEAERTGQMRVRVDMGPPGLDWWRIPLATALDTRRLTVDLGCGLQGPGCVSMGNPHVVFFVEDLAATPVARIGPMMERHPLFPERANVGFCQVVDDRRIRLRVWERGVGETRACGTGACAAAVAAHRQGLADRRVVVELDGGDLEIDWSDVDDHVRMTGPVSVEFAGRLPAPEGFL